jgi:subtilase family serine protease
MTGQIRQRRWTILANPARWMRPVVAVAGLFAVLPLAMALPDGADHMKADLTIEAVQVAPANPGRLRVKVANQGLSPAVETQLVLIYHHGDDVAVRSAVVPLLETGERQWLVVEGGTLLREADKVLLRIDDPDRVDESDEANNGAEFP